MTPRSRSSGPITSLIFLANRQGAINLCRWKKQFKGLHRQRERRSVHRMLLPISPMPVAMNTASQRAGDIPVK